MAYLWRPPSNQCEQIKGKKEKKEEEEQEANYDGGQCLNGLPISTTKYEVMIV